MSPQKPPSRQDLIREQQRSTFVGRVKPLEAFEHNLTRLQRTAEGFAYPEHFLFNVWGQGGVGKTTLLGRFEDIAKQHNGVAARIDEAIDSVPEVMAAFASQLKGQGQALSRFDERYKVYRQKREELETDPEAPQGFSAFVGKTVARVGLSLGRQIPVAGMAVDWVDGDAIADTAGEWATYVTRKLKNKDEIQLVNEPVEVLTPLFLEDLEEISERQIVLLFDTYERTGEALDQWLLDILTDRYGSLPNNCIWVIAGRDQLNPNSWSGWAPVQFPIEPFTPEEATQFLQRKGVTNPEVIKIVLEVSGRLPLLLAVLAENASNDPNEVGEASGTAVERFLKWVDDPKKRALAIDAALPQSLNRDVVTCLVGDADSEALFSWLKTMPFVRERSDGWAYHDVVRPQMLRYQQRESASRWAERHGLLASYYEGICQRLELTEEARYSDSVWQRNTLSQLYHRLCSHPQKGLSTALNQFLDALKQKLSFAQEWAGVMLQAGQDTDADALRTWGDRLVKGLQAYDDDKYTETVAAFTALLKFGGIELRTHSIVLAWRGKVYRLMSSYEKALIDFDRAIELEPEYKWAIASRGDTYRDMKQYEEALIDYSRTIELDPEDKWAIKLRGDTHRLMERYEEALIDYSRAIELDPEHGWAVVARRGDTYRLMERYEEALIDYSRAIELDPEYDWAIAHRGLTYRSMERYEEALIDYSRAIELDPEDKRTIANRGLTYRLMEQYEEALMDFSRAIELDPEYDWVIANRGLIYRLMEQYEEALMDFSRAIELDPEDKRAITNRGETYQEVQRYEEALIDFNRAIELDPEYRRAITSRGETYQEVDRYREALFDFTRAAELDPSNGYALSMRGLTYLLSKQYEIGLKELTAAIETEAHSPNYCCRTLAYICLGQIENAKADLSQAIRLAQQDYKQDPNQHRNTFNLGLYYLMARNPKKAKDYYKEALRRGAPISVVNDAISDLKKLLIIISDHPHAHEMKGFLQSVLSQRQGSAIARHSPTHEMQLKSEVG